MLYFLFLLQYNSDVLRDGAVCLVITFTFASSFTFYLSKNEKKNKKNILNANLEFVSVI